MKSNICSVFFVFALIGCGSSEKGDDLIRVWSTVGNRDVAGIVLPVHPKGFDYRLGKYRIGDRETNGPQFSEKCSSFPWKDSAEVWMREATVWLPDGYINRILITSKNGTHSEVMEQAEKRIGVYSQRFGLEFKDTAKSNPDKPIRSADVVNGIQIVIAVLNASESVNEYFWCISLDATDFVSRFVKSGDGSANGLKDLWLGGEAVGHKCLDNGDKWHIRKMTKPIRHFQNLVLTDQNGYIDTITMRGKVNDKEGGYYPDPDPETQEIIRNELNSLRDMYSKKYGLKFKCESISEFWKFPTYVANVDEKKFPGVLLKIKCPGKLSDDGLEYYHVSVLLDASSYVSRYIDWMTKFNASKKMLTEKDGIDAL